MRFLHGAGEFPWQMLLVFVIMGFVGAMVWWQAKKAWSLALILIIELTIFDIGGRSIATMSDATMAQGDHELPAPPAGLYLYRLSCDGRITTGKLSIAR